MHPAIVIMVAIVLGSGIMVGTVIGAHKVAAPPEAPVFLEQAETPGTDPFVPLAQPAPAAPPAPGSAGSGDLGRCDPETLVAYLASHPAQAQAWVDALNSDPALRWSGGSRVSVEQIPAYVAELRPVTLNADARVTNHQFTGGRAVAVQSVLQRGTAVLVDAAGVARVRCACGNPLTPKRQITAPPRYVGVPWSGFRPVRVEVTIINRTDVDIHEETRERCGRDEYYDGDRCRPAVVCPPGQYLGEDERCYFPEPAPEPEPCPAGSQRDDDEEACEPVPPCPADSARDEASDACAPPGCPDEASPLPDGSCPEPVDCPPGETNLGCSSSPPCAENAPDAADEPCSRPPDQGTSCPGDTVADETSGACTSSPPTAGCPGGTDPQPDGTCPAPPVTCAGGTTVPAGTACPDTEQTCPDGSAAPASGTCPEPVQTCPDGATVPAGSTCPEPVRTCPDGSTVPAGGTCPEPVRTCPDGSTVPAGGTCPEPVRTCPDGTTVPAGSSCPEPVQTCPDGSTAPASGTCPEPVETCPDGSTVPAGEPCTEPTTTDSSFRLRVRASDSTIPV